MTYKELPEPITYRKLSPQKVVCPLKPNPKSYRVNLQITLDECQKCEYHRGNDDEVVACAFKKEEE